MRTITNQNLTYIKTRIARIDTLLDPLYTAYENGTTEIESYMLDTGDGEQKTKYRSLDEILDQIQRLESIRDRLTRRLNGTGIVNMNLRRRQGGI